MALGVLSIGFIILLITAIIIQILLYRRKSETGNSIFIINMLLGILLAYLAFTALPTNDTGQRALAIVWGVLAVFAVVLKLTIPKFMTKSKILLSIAIIVGLVKLI
ncbi:hypothetical protein [Sporosarcina sp. 6E9]|uniref:hypothetical protein n=1 Tax=Sporosarcina sp. 6E9 TaxID=2819235 RepID=UPI001B301326|nr:hypothetical protein [Sporosarcina sp. 6E9]